jgi:hypothetical protein
MPKKQKKRRKNPSSGGPKAPNRQQRREAEFGQKVRIDNMPEIDTPKEKSQDTTPRALVWLRGIGAISIFGGCGSMLAEFYKVSVIAFYAGGVLLLVDLAFERMHRLIKILFCAVLIAAATYFTMKVTLHKNPISIDAAIVPPNLNGMPSPTALLIDISNDSSSDYKDLDFVVRTAPRKPDMIGRSYQNTKLEGVTIFQDLPLETKAGTGDSFSPRFIKGDGPVFIPAGNVANFRRIRCNLLPHNFTLQITMEMSNDESVKEVFVPSEINVEGDFNGKFSKPLVLREKISVDQTSIARQSKGDK